MVYTSRSIAFATPVCGINWVTMVSRVPILANLVSSPLSTSRAFTPSAYCSVNVARGFHPSTGVSSAVLDGGRQPSRSLRPFSQREHSAFTKRSACSQKPMLTTSTIPSFDSRMAAVFRNTRCVSYFPSETRTLLTVIR